MASKKNGKTESFKTWWDRQYEEKGEGGKADWTDPKTGKTRSILLTHDKSKLKPKSKSLLSKAGDAIKSVVKETPAAEKKIRAKYQTSGPGTKRGARQRSRMKKELRDANAATESKAKVAAKIKDIASETGKLTAKREEEMAANRAAQAAKPAPEKTRTVMQTSQSKLLEPGERRSKFVEKEVKEPVNGKRTQQSMKLKPGQRGRMGHAHGGKVRGVGIAKRGHGRGRNV